jgi:hypothetical protein
MLKKILITFLIVPVVGSAIYGYFYFKQVKTPLTPVLKAIPNDAVCITEAHDFTDTWKSFSKENAIWKELLSVDAFKALNGKINFFDSVFVHGQEVLKIEDNTKIYLSVHADTAKGVDFLLAFNIPLTAEKRAVNEIIEKAIPVMYTKSDTLVAGIAVHQYKLRDGKKFYYYLNNTVFALSYSPDLIEKSALTLVNDASLLKNKSFVRVLKTAGSESNANVFVNFNNLSKIMPQYLNEDNVNFIAAMSNFAQWISMDLNLKNDVIAMNGFSYSDSAAADYLSIFKHQKAPKIELTSVMPLNTAFFSYTGVSDGQKYLRDLKLFRQKNILQGEQDQTLRTLEKKYGIDLNYFFNCWIGNEMATLITESYGEKYAPEQYAIFKARDISKAITAFSELEQSMRVNASTENESDSIETAIIDEYRGYKLYPFGLPSVLSLMFGKAFPSYSSYHYTMIGNYVVFAKNQSSLRSLINFCSAGRTLNKDRHYVKFAENLSENANFFVYSAVARSPKLYARQLESSLAKQVEKNTSLFRKFQSLALQFKGSGDLFYNNLCLKYNPVYKPEFNTLWDTELDTTLITPAYAGLNLLDSTDLYFMQDANFTIHLLDQHGKLIWSKPVGEKVLGKIHQIHANKAGNFRLAFVSEKHLFMIDEKGEFPENFPVTLKANATAGIGLICFSGKENPLLLVACDNLSIYNYKINGSIDTDWKTDRLKDTLRSEFIPFTCDGREMICFADEGKNLRLIDKKGNWIVKFKEKLPALYNNVFYLDIKKTLNASAVLVSDEKGIVFRYNFKGVYDKYELMPKVSKNYHFAFADIDNDKKGEFIFTDNNRLNVINKDKTIKFDFTFNSRIDGAAQLVVINDSTSKLAVSTKDEGLFLFDHNGALNRGISLAGKTPVSITAIDNKKYYFAVTTFGKRIMAHAIDNEPVQQEELIP